MTSQNSMLNHATSNAMMTATVKHDDQNNNNRREGQMDSLLSLADMDFFLGVFGSSSSSVPPPVQAKRAEAGIPPSASQQQGRQQQYHYPPVVARQGRRSSIDTSAIAESVLMEISDDIFSDDFLPPAQQPPRFLAASQPNPGLQNSAISGMMDDGMNFAPDELEPTPIDVMTRKHRLFNSNSSIVQTSSSPPAAAAAVPQWLLTPQQQFTAASNNNNINTSYSVEPAASRMKREYPVEQNNDEEAFLSVKRRRVSPSVSPRPAAMVPSNVMPFMGLLPAAGMQDDEPNKAGGEVTRFRGYQEDQWNEKYQELCDFIGSNGHCQVPHRTSDKESLSRWCKRQRYQYKLMHEGKPSTMTQERIASLNAINFVWDSHGAIWEERIQELKEYRQLHGHCSIPSNFPLNQKLATWVKCQRRQYKLFQSGKKSNMTIERIVRLNQLGFIWELRSHPTSD